MLSLIFLPVVFPRMIAVVESPLLSSLLPPWVVTEEVVTVMFPKPWPELTTSWMFCWALIAALEPAALGEETAMLTMTEPWVMERTTIWSNPTPAALAIALMKLK